MVFRGISSGNKRKTVLEPDQRPQKGASREHLSILQRAGRHGPHPIAIFTRVGAASSSYSSITAIRATRPPSPTRVCDLRLSVKRSTSHTCTRHGQLICLPFPVVQVFLYLRSYGQAGSWFITVVRSTESHRRVRQFRPLTRSRRIIISGNFAQEARGHTLVRVIPETLGAEVGSLFNLQLARPMKITE